MAASSRTLTLTLSLVVTAVLAVVIQQHPAMAQTAPNAPAATTARIVSAAQAVATSLDDAGRAKLQFPFESPQKTKWSNLPSPMFQRFGIRLADLTAPQRDAVMKLLTIALSAEGYQKVTDIMRGDETLKRNPSAGAPPGGGGRGGPPPGGGGPGGARSGGPSFGQDEYYLAFLGAPSTTTPWMLQYGGHHLAINLTMSGNQATMAPSLPAA
jgi:hypothetical protein